MKTKMTMTTSKPINVKEMRQDIVSSIEDIAKFIYSDVVFQMILKEFKQIPNESRDYFIRSTIINKEELKRRGVKLPEDMIIQRSTFGDGRMTLFCITKYLKDKKRKVTITFDEGWEKFI